MKVLLHYKAADFDLARQPVWNAKALIEDLNLEKLLQVMGGGDELIQKAARTAVLTGPGNDEETIFYRQEILRDCLQQRDLVRELYGIATAAITARKEHWFYLSSQYPSTVLSSAAGLIALFADFLEHLRLFASANKPAFRSEGLRRLLESFQTDLSAGYLAEVKEVLGHLRFGEAMLLSARLGPGNRGGDYTFRRLQEKRPGWWRRLFPRKPAGVYQFSLHPRDESGARALAALRDGGVAPAAAIMAGAADHVLGFFQQLQLELAFYLGCLNLAEKLEAGELPISFPEISGRGEACCGKRLYDVCLALTLSSGVVGNDLDDRGRGLVIITGANQGGKSTFLRSIGLAHLMLQAGMFVGAEEFSAAVCDDLFTHFKREEDTGMKSGKFDEEMSRMSEIADRVKGRAVGLFNESFSATNEREGSEIARQIVIALREAGIRVFFVTHLYEFAHKLYEAEGDRAVFLRAERRSDMQRTYKVLPGEPLPTSYALDIYRRLFPQD